MNRIIFLTNLLGTEISLNCDLIETITSNPDTTITLTTGTLHIVMESRDEVIQKTVDYKTRIFQSQMG